MAVIFAVCETYYFGWNLYPKSVPEVFCDALAIMLAVLAIS